MLYYGMILFWNLKWLNRPISRFNHDVWFSTSSPPSHTPHVVLTLNIFFDLTSAPILGVSQLNYHSVVYRGHQQGSIIKVTIDFTAAHRHFIILSLVTWSSIKTLLNWHPLCFYISINSPISKYLLKQSKLHQEYCSLAKIWK